MGRRTVQFDHGRPATYQIVVHGRLDERWSDWLDGMTIAAEHDRDGKPVTTLTGTVADQAALRSLLSRIWDLNLSVVKVYRTTET
jgi:hypothetical protein